MANLTITLDDEDKKGIAEFCEQVGMTISGLYNVFTKQVLREGRIPFEIGINTQRSNSGDEILVENIYQKRENILILELIRTGTHADLFDK